jgi:hypothetical protein
MSGLEHHNSARLCGSLAHTALTVVEQAPQALAVPQMCQLPHPVGAHIAAHLTAVHLDQYQQQIIVSQGFIWAIQTGHLLNRIKSKTL